MERKGDWVKVGYKQEAVDDVGEVMGEVKVKRVDEGKGWWEWREGEGD